ncbi:hypothetical protein DFA_04535 [Cavenderia fasciculata]|uniref:Transmembrane protein n=1 Tax=Cavenderia fasciculata TaxID=261658 RepID=F4PPV1_CACFS|nr:uncharacterized protein DFA_04535 [Cavenderia fasciculata]EGG22414.1 hypothetical protein DFA_04535 [Cavenderia fasciculata]|eukprot:XP_004360265.1 hypothetical protein DFA_04535 [Cavenderia fasciculata]
MKRLSLSSKSTSTVSWRSPLISLFIHFTILLILSSVVYTSSIIHNTNNNNNNNNNNIVYSTLPNGKESKDSLLNSIELENSEQLYHKIVNADEFVNDGDRNQRESNRQEQQEQQEQDVNFNNKQKNNEPFNTDQLGYVSTTTSSSSSSSSSNNDHGGDKKKIQVLAAPNKVENAPRRQTSSNSALTNQGGGECQVEEPCRKCSPDERKKDPFCAKTGYKKVLNCNNQITSYSCTDTSRLSSNILFFELGILTVLLISLYFVKERKKFMMQQNNDRLARQLNKL